ncbi:MULTISPECIES: head GIN domain-containing protein [Niastella]|uniref:DUF2807 domain-containing protein n=1 Tax=Niastella soli TaxID=2821487 RepID=A0ABS3YWE4_9BACT|nr:head GIN domain-containing protein [Niastella soli]MBO9201491.1 DUF2807 domain-containing protein [Niastella soli]
MKKTAVVLFVALIAFTSCFWHGHRVKGNGHMTTETKQFGDIKGVELHSSFDVILIQGSPSGIKIEAEENIISHIEMHVENDVLNIETEDNIWLQPRKHVRIYVTSPEFNTIKSHGSGNIKAETKITSSNKLKLGASGSGDINIEVDAPEIAASVSGSGGIELKGETKKIYGDVSGSGNIKALNLMAEESDLNVSGSGNVQVYSSVKLHANVSGSGDVKYKGEAKTSTNISGSGSVKKVD